MTTMPKTGLRTPTDGVDPFTAIFDNEFATDVDDWIDANAADLNASIRVSAYGDLPRYDSGSGNVIWGNFRILSPRYTLDQQVASGSAAISNGQCLYINAPARPFNGAVVVPVVAAMPITPRDRIVVGILVDGQFYLMPKISDTMKGAQGAAIPRTVVVQHGANPAANGTNLIAAYATAKTMSPTLASRVTVVVPPGEYDLGALSLAVDTDYIDIKGYGEAAIDLTDGTPFYPATYIRSSSAVAVLQITARTSDITRLRIGNTGAGSAVNIDEVNGADGLKMEWIYATAPTSGIGIGATGTTKAINSGFKNCLSVESILRCQQFGGTAMQCAGGAYSFCSYLGDTTKVECNGVLIDCWTTNFSYGYNDSGDAEISGRLLRCYGMQHCYGVSQGGSPYYGTFSADARNCTATGHSFGGGDVTSGQHRFTGEARDCYSGLDSFGGNANGLFSGMALRCEANNTSFGCGGMTGSLGNCVIVGLISNMLVPTGGQIYDSFFAAGGASVDVDGGYLRNCIVQTLDPSIPVLITNSAPNNPRVEKCTIHSYAAANAIGGTGTGLIIHCSMNVPILGTVTNLEATPYNVVNPAVAAG